MHFQSPSSVGEDGSFCTLVDGNGGKREAALIQFNGIEFQSELGSRMWRTELTRQTKMERLHIQSVPFP